MNHLIRILLTLSLVNGSALAGTALDHMPSFDVWLKASGQNNVSAQLIYSVALVESGRYTQDHRFVPWPFAIGVGRDLSIGQYEHLSLYPDTLQEAKIVLSSLMKAGHQNLGIGIMQVNIKANGHLVEDPIHLLDPVTNINAALKVIGQCNKNRSTTEMLSCYSYGLYDSEGGYLYAQKVFDYQQRFANHFVKKNRPYGEITIDELNTFFQNRSFNNNNLDGTPHFGVVEIVE